MRGKAVTAACGSVLLALAGCGQAPIKPAATHLSADLPAPEGAIPAPVQLAPVLPPPKPAPRTETYTVVVNNVRVQDLLFALARDAKLNVDIHPGIGGTVTLNAIDQTLPQLLNRIAKQIDMRYEIDGPNLLVMRDTPYLRSYKVDFVSASRNVAMRSFASTQFAATGAAAGGTAGGTAGTGSTATIDVAAANHLWESIVQNIRDILRETDKGLAGAGGAAALTVPAASPQTPAAPSATPAAAASNVGSQEAAAVIGNRETGVLFVRASSRQHERIQEFLDQTMTSAKRQVLVEATIAEVQLNNQYQRGIDWQRLRSGVPAALGTGVPAFGTGNSGIEFRQQSAGTPAAIDTTAFVLGGALNSLNLNVAVKLLESFGDVRVLSSPKISVLNNQTALLRVTRDIVYFTITPSTTPITIAGGSGNLTLQQAFTTTPNVAAEGFMMSVLPQISDAESVVLNVRPTIRRRIAFATDPNPALSAAAPNLIPVFESRELDSVLRIQSGQTAVLGGLIQDSVTNTEDTIPGLREIPGIGQLFAQRKDVNVKTELVIFLRATVIRDPSVAGDYRGMRDLLPGRDYFLKPNPGRAESAEP